MRKENPRGATKGTYYIPTGAPRERDITIIRQVKDLSQNLRATPRDGSGHALPYPGTNPRRYLPPSRGAIFFSRTGLGSAVKGTFIPAQHFEGKKLGYFFAKGVHGLGYYMDAAQAVRTG